MMQLPAHLRPWAAQLALFPEDLAVSLGGMVQRLAGLLGVDGPGRHDPLAPPDGVDGVGVRGPVERMLISEWLLASEVPDEFLRRAAAGQLSLLQRARSRPSGSGRCLVLVDTGPSNMGAPRLAVLAMLVVMARRAARNGVEMEWGVLQDGIPLVHQGMDEAGVKALLEARTLRSATAYDVELWRNEHGPFLAKDDVWVVGAPQAARWLPEAGVLTVEESTQPDIRALTVTVEQRGSRRSTTLPLPPETACVRLIRNPFEAPRVATAWATTSTPVFAGNGRWLFARDKEGGLLAYAVHDAGELPGAIRAPIADGLLLAASTQRKHFVAVASRLGKWMLLRRAPRGTWTTLATFSQPNVEEAPRHLTPGPGTILRVPRGMAAGEEYLFVDPQRRLWRANLSSSELRLVETEVLALRRVQTGILIVSCSDDGVVLTRLGSLGTEPKVHTLAGTSFSARVGAADAGFGDSALVAASRSDGWILHSHGPDTLITPHPETHVVGVARAERTKLPGLLCLDDDCRVFTLHTREGARVVTRMPEPVLFVAQSPVDDAVGCVLQSGTVIIFHVSRGAVLLRYDPQDAA